MASKEFRRLCISVASQYPFSLALALSASIMAWLYFYPTVFSRDAFYILLGAIDGDYSDLHPLLIPSVLSLILKVGGDISLVTLAQILFGLLGVRRLAIASVRLFGVDEAVVADRIAFVVLALLVTPLTPLLIYLATLWYDTWLAIFLLWVLALLLELYRNRDGQGRVTSEIALVIILISLVILARYNAIVMYPFLALCLEVVLKRSGYSNLDRMSLVVAPLVLSALFLVVQYRAQRIVRSHPEHAVYALDLASMIKYDPSICRNPALESCDSVLQFSPQFRVGDGAIDLTLNEGNEYLYEPFAQLVIYPRLEEELSIAAVDHPLLFLTVNFLNYIDFIGPHPNQYYFQRSIPSKDKVQLPGQSFASPHSAWFSWAGEILSNPILRWFSYVHVIWIVINMLGLIACAWLSRREIHAAYLGRILLIPAAYYAGYLIALTTSEFRFMFPSMLLVQVITLTLLISLPFQRGAYPHKLGACKKPAIHQ